MLTLSDIGRPIAVVHGGDDDGEVVSIVNENEYDPDDDDIESEYEFDGLVIPIPNPTERQVSYVAGPSGSGKSTYSSIQAEKYRKIFPYHPIYIFSRLDKDPAFDGKFNPKPIRMKIDQSLITNPIDITKYKGGMLIIFDDIDTIQDDKLKKAVMKLQNDILEIGRHSNIHIICCSHLINPNDRKFGRTMLNEAHALTIFPKSGSTYQINYCLKNYFGLSKEQIQEILQLPSRWVTIAKTFPQCIIYENGAYLLS